MNVINISKSINKCTNKTNGQLRKCVRHWKVHTHTLSHSHTHTHTHSHTHTQIHTHTPLSATLRSLINIFMCFHCAMHTADTLVRPYSASINRLCECSCPLWEPRVLLTQ